MRKSDYPIDEIEEGLRRLTHQKWDQHAPSISMAAIKKQVSMPFLQLGSSNLFMKMAAASLFLGAYFLLFYHPIETPTMVGFGNLSLPTPQIPYTTNTPTPQNTATQSKECSKISYTVQQGDSLDGIAASFSVSVASILKDNQLSSSNITPGASLMIIICQATEELSTHQPNQTITFTPHR
jgi:LysM repeat protein